MNDLLKGQKVYLRALEPADVNILYQWENNTAVWAVSNTASPYSKYMLEQYIENSTLDIYTTKQLRLVICDHSGLALGCIDLFDFDPRNQRAGIGILIAEEKERQKGYAREALDLVCTYCFEVLHLHQVFCHISDANKASLELFGKKGFEMTGTKKEWNKTAQGWEDECILQLLNKD
jgi:diamine N-acetyltransferase